MFNVKTIKTLILSALSIAIFASEFKTDFSAENTRHWLGEDFWANRPQDWRVNEGRLECLSGNQPLRNVHLLTHNLSDKRAAFQCSVELCMIEWGEPYGVKDFAGFLIGSGDPSMNYLARATAFHVPGKNHGLAAVIDGNGWISLYDLNNHARSMALKYEGAAFLLDHDKNKARLDLKMIPNKDKYTITISLTDKDGKLLQTAIAENVDANLLTGDIGLVSNLGLGETGKSFCFENWTASGEKLIEVKSQKIGGVIGTLYTVSENVLRMTGQLQPVAENDNRKITLEIKDKGNYKEIDTTEICYPGWYGTFVIENWDASKEYEYRVKYELDGKAYYHSGIIRKEPTDKAKLKIAAFTGNNNFAGSFDDWKATKIKNYDFTRKNIWYPHDDITTNVLAHNPDLLVWTGDQIYEHRPIKADLSGDFPSYIDYVWKWSFFYLAHNKLLANYPSVCLIDDHDIWQINLWGKGGAKSLPPKDGKFPKEYLPWRTFMWAHDQGYILPGEWVNMVEGSQMNHMPLPYDSKPLLQGILPRYGAMKYAGVSFAMLEDRKHKSSPLDFVPEARPCGGHIKNKEFDVSKADKVGAKLYGDKQLEFINTWSKDWKNSRMKIVLSQTILANAQTGAGVMKTYPNENKNPDFDSAGWPQTGRSKALTEIRRAFAFVIAGDQHLGSIIQHGIDDWNDCGYSFCVPAIGNQAPRRWTPNIKGKNHIKGMPRYTGEYLDGFNNKITVWAASNPWNVEVEPGPLHDRATGYGIINLNKKEQTIEMECWPRYANVNNPSEQYVGWPKTITMQENYGRKALGYLPELDLTNVKKPVVQVINEKNKEVIYTVAIKNIKYSPKVFEDSSYTIIVLEDGEKVINKLLKQEIVNE